MSDKKEIPEADPKNNLTDALSQAKEPEDKIKAALDFMREALAQEGSPRLRDFWEAKALCLPLFKQRLSPAARAYFWEEFVELSDEARRLKDVLDEQSAFAADAIDKAILAIESDFQDFDAHVAKAEPLVLPKSAKGLLTDIATYQSNYVKIVVLTSFSSRINALKQEVSKTSMRVRQKGRIFQKLQELRAQILPMRSELVKIVSGNFLSDVTNFVSQHENTPGKPFYALRDDIKALQELSKTLSISTDAFGQVRELLSGLWDHIRKLDKDRKKVQNEKRQVQEKNRDEALSKFEALQKRIEEEKLNDEKAKPHFNEMYSYLRNLDLHRDHVKELKAKLTDMQDALEAPKTSVAAEKADAMEAKSAELEKVRVEEEAKIEKALHELSGGTLEAIEKYIESLDGEITNAELMDPILDLRIEKKQEQLLEQDEVLVSEVESLLEMRNCQRERLKKRLETLRKTLGASNLDFEKSMLLQDELEQAKGVLETVEEAIKALNELIADA